MSDSGVDEGLLTRAPCWVFRAVAEADGRIDTKERRRLEELIRDRESFDTEWMKSALAKAEGRLDELFAEIDQNPGRVKAELEALATEAEQRLSAEDAKKFKHDLLSLGKTIAMASGGGVLGLGDKIDDSEKEALSLLISVLRYQPD